MSLGVQGSAPSRTATTNRASTRIITRVGVSIFMIASSSSQSAPERGRFCFWTNVSAELISRR